MLQNVNSMTEKILIVDDDIDSLKLIGLMLQRQGYEVVAANTGNQGISKAHQEQPDLIILDVMMPDMNGYEVCRRLRGVPETQTIPIIMFTAKTLIDDKVAGFEAGADDYLTKPTHPAELVSRVKAILERSANQRVKDSGSSYTIGVLGVKGGVGTTTLALNMGAALKAAGENPIVADFRPGAGALGLLMGVNRSFGIANVLTKTPDEIRPTLVEKELVTHQTGLRALLSSTRPREAHMNISTDSAAALIKCLRSMTKTVILDMGCGFSSLVSNLQPEIDRFILLLEPNNIAISMANELYQELANLGKERLHFVVVNRNPVGVAQTSWQDIETALGQELRAIIAAAPEIVFKASETGTPFVNLQPTAIISSQVIKLTEELTTKTKIQTGNKLKT